MVECLITKNNIADLHPVNALFLSITNYDGLFFPFATTSFILLDDIVHL